MLGIIEYFSVCSTNFKIFMISKTNIKRHFEISRPGIISTFDQHHQDFLAIGSNFRFERMNL